jgi:hypothetical protein
MSKTLLQQLYDGEVYPAEDIKLIRPEDKELSQKNSKEMEYFEDLLSPEDYRRLEKLDDKRQDENSAYEYANFVYGFRLGMGMAIEALTSEDGKEKII